MFLVLFAVSTDSKNIYQRPSMLEKIKKFGSISKNEISKGISKIAKKRSSLGSLSTSQSKFYESAEIDDDACHSPKYDSKSLNVKAKGLSKLQRLGRLTISKLPTNFSLNEPYENTIYQENQISSPNLSKSMNEVTSPGNQAAAAAVNKSLKTKLRKSFTPLIGSSSTSNIYGALSSKNSTFYVTESLDVDSGIFSLNGKATTSPNNSNLSLSSNSNTATVTSDSKRRSISMGISNRPNNPPPPPPSEKNSNELHETLQACSLDSPSDSPATWFKEFELFKDEASDHNGEAENKKSMSSWYTEIGLYQTSNNSIAR